MLLPFMCVDLRCRVPPLVVACDASEMGVGVVRTTSITSEGRRALPDFQNAALPIEDRLGLIELAPNDGTVRQALAPPLGASRRVSCRAHLRDKQATVENDSVRWLQDDQEIDESACQHLVVIGTIASAAEDPDIFRVAQMMQAIARQATVRIFCV